VELTAVVSPSVRPEPGETVPVTVPASAVHVFDGETGESLRTSRESDPRSKTVRS
jgi:multiple sugar transport system ATP-binding protein